MERALWNFYSLLQSAETHASIHEKKIQDIQSAFNSFYHLNIPFSELRS